MAALTLRPLRAADEAEALRAHDELAADGFELLLGWEPGLSWTDYLVAVERTEQGVDLAPGRVPASFRVGVVDDRIVGRASIRHRLTPYLLEVGGHIGYCVRPADRRQGHATAMLRLSLDLVRDLGVDRALVTCDDDNVGSIRTIERCGGKLEDTRSDAGVPKRRYWVPTG